MESFNENSDPVLPISDCHPARSVSPVEYPGGQKFKARIRGDHIELVPVPPLTAARGFLQGLDTEVEREA